MKISFEGIGERTLTFIGEGVKAGDAVKVTGAGTVSPCGAGDAFDGFVTGLSGEYAGVVIGGAVTVPYSGAEPGFGRVELSADGGGGVAAAESGGVKCLVVDVDSADKSVTFIM